MSIGETFRALHDRPSPFVIPNPWDIGSARILASMGFEALATTSAGMSFAMGVREGSVSREQSFAHCSHLVEAMPLPVAADLENGYGDTPEAVADTIHAAAQTGLAGGSIEDHTGDRKKSIYDKTLAIERIAAACEARDALPSDFVLTARCESLSWGGTDVDAVIRRLQAYEAAGADVLYAPELPGLTAIREACAALTKPVNVVMGMPGATYSMTDLAEAGVKRISVGSAFFRVAYGAMIDAAREALDDGTFIRTQAGIGFAEIETFFDE